MTLALSIDLVGAPLTYACDTSSGSTPLLLPVGLNADQMVVTNDGPGTICVAFGADDSVEVATSGEGQGYMILAKSKEVVSVSSQMRYAAVEAKSGPGGDVQFQRAIGQ